MQSEFGFNKARWWSLCTSLWEAQCKVYADFTLMDAGDLGTGFPMSCYLERTKVCVCPPRAKGKIQTTGFCSFRHWPLARVGTTSKSGRDPAGCWGQNIFSIHFIKTWCCSKWMRATSIIGSLRPQPGFHFPNRIQISSGNNKQQIWNLSRTCYYWLHCLSYGSA